MRRLPVRVSDHALSRGRQRDCLTGPLTMRYEVEKAIEEGRVAKTQPRWSAAKQRRHKGRAGARWAWNLERTRCYLIHEQDDRQRNRVIVILTVIGARRDTTVDEAGVLGSAPA